MCSSDLIQPHPADTWPLARRLLWEQIQIPGLIREWKANAYLSFGSFGLLHCPCPQVMICAQPLYFSDRYYREYARLRPALRLEELGRRALLKASARRADRILTQTEAMRSQIVAQLGVPTSRISVIPHGVHESFFQDDGRPTGHATPLAATPFPNKTDGVVASKRRVLYVSIHQVHKDFDTLVRAAAIVRAHGRGDVEFTFTGAPDDTEFSRATASLVRELGLEETVHFVGLVPNDQIHDLYASADIFAFPSWAETFGIPLVEAMNCDVPVITSNVTSLPEIAGDAALLVNPNDVDSIAEAMQMVTTDKELRDSMIERGREQRKQFSWEKSAELLWKAMEKAVS